MSYQPDVMLYHANCADGFGAAWAVWIKWGNAVDFRPVSYGQEPPSDLAGKHVLIGDFSYKREIVDEMAKVTASLIILDHHKTAENELSAFVGGYSYPLTFQDGYLKSGEFSVAANFDMERSGARMIWDFCFPGETAPPLIELIEDRDLWRFQFDDTKPFSLWLRSEPFNFERWEIIAQDLVDGRGRASIMSEARAMQRFSDQKVSEIASLSRLGLINGVEVPLCNCPPMFASEVGHKLLDDYPDTPFVACYSDQGKARGYSLRSRDDRADVSEIARKFGGGGHRNAAGFGVPLP